jgi:hypothetical protein
MLQLPTGKLHSTMFQAEQRYLSMGDERELKELKENLRTLSNLRNVVCDARVIFRFIRVKLVSSVSPPHLTKHETLVWSGLVL